MSTSPDNDLDLNLHFLPDWAKKSSDANLYSQYTGTEGDERSRRRGPRDRRPPRRHEGGAPSRRQDGGGPRGRRSQGDRKFGGPRGRGRDKPRRMEAPLPDIKVSFVADEKGVDSLARQIKMTGRAFPLFEIGRMILEKPERHSVILSTMKGTEGTVLQRMYLCALDDSVWLHEDEAIRHVLDKHFDAFYQTEKIPAEPPKGTYTFVAQCGMSGKILGPPNHHDYQNKLRQLHQERFARMSYDTFKARVKIVRDEEVVKQWIEEQSWTTEYVCLNLPEAKKLTSKEEVEQHFREIHKDNIVREIESHTMPGPAAHAAASPVIRRLVRSQWEDQRRFPLKVVNVLSQQFASRGLQFFKVNKSFTHVSVARPHYLDLESNPVSDGVRRIVEFIMAHEKCNRKQLIEALAPSPPPSAPKADAGVEPIPAEGGPTTPPEPAAEEPKTPDAPAGEAADAPSAAAPPPAPTTPPVPTAEQQAVITDLHWLIHQGHVIEFANGFLETAKKPAAPKPKAAATASAPSESAAKAAKETASDAAPGPPAAPEETAEAAASGASSASTAEPESPRDAPPSTAETEKPPVENASQSEGAAQPALGTASGADSVTEQPPASSTLPADQAAAGDRAHDPEPIPSPNEPPEDKKTAADVSVANESPAVEERGAGGDTSPGSGNSKESAAPGEEGKSTQS